MTGDAELEVVRISGGEEFGEVRRRLWFACAHD